MAEFKLNSIMLHTILKPLRFLILGLSVLAIPLSGRAITDTNEIWISATNSAAWLGTGYINTSPRAGSITNPLYGDFDSLLYKVGPNTRIHLLPGEFITSGWQYGVPTSPYLKENDKLIGAGRDVTIITRTNTANELITMLKGAGNGIEISDLTVNAGGAQSDSKKSAISISDAWGVPYSGASIRRVKAINVVGNGYECFALGAGGPGTTNTLIEDCEVSSVRGTYVTAIVLGGEGKIRGCHVYLPLLTNMAHVYQAYQPNGTHNAVIDGNFSDGGATALETDAYGETNLTIINNSFVRCAIGIGLGKTAPNVVDGLIIRNNIIQISTNLPSDGPAGCISVQNNDSTGAVIYRNFDVSGNIMQYYGNGGQSGSGYPGAVNFYSAARTNLVNVRVIDNAIEREFTYFMAYAKGVVFSGNVDQQGNPLDVINVTGSASDFYLDEPQTTAIVASDCTVNRLRPPHSFNYKGREFTVINLRTNSIDVVGTWWPTQEYVIGSQTVAGSKTCKFTADGLGNWIRQSY